METTPVVCFVGSSGAGKTTLLEKLIPQFMACGLKVGTIKHDVHGFEVDRPGKDSWKHKQAGASQTVISSPRQLAIIRETDHDWWLDELVRLFTDVDIILAEGYKKAGAPKIAVVRPGISEETVNPADKTLLAVVSPEPIYGGMNVFQPHDIKGIVGFLADHFKLLPSPSAEPDEAA